MEGLLVTVSHHPPQADSLSLQQLVLTHMHCRCRAGARTPLLLASDHQNDLSQTDMFGKFSKELLLGGYKVNYRSCM